MNASGCGVTVREYGHMLQRRRGLCGEGRAHQRTDARPERAAARAGAGCCKARVSAPRRRASPTTRPARCSTARSCAAASKRNLRALGFDVQVAHERSAPVLRLGRHLLGAAARAGLPAARPQARPPERSCSRPPSSRPTSAASRTCKAAARRRCGTGSSCSTRRWPRPERTRGRARGPTRARRAHRGASMPDRPSPGACRCSPPFAPTSLRGAVLCACVAAPWIGAGPVRRHAADAEARAPRSYVCGGIGSDESTAMRAAMKDHPLSLLFARADGAYLADVAVTSRTRAAPPRSRCAPPARCA